MVNREMKLLDFGDVIGRNLDRDIGERREIAARSGRESDRFQAERFRRDHRVTDISGSARSADRDKRVARLAEPVNLLREGEIVIAIVRYRREERHLRGQRNGRKSALEPASDLFTASSLELRG